jgi:hypothetical protein
MTTDNSMRRFGLVLQLAVVSWLILPLTVQAGDFKLEAVLVLGTNDGKPAGSNLKPVTESIAKNLNSLPFKFTNYFEVNRNQFDLKNGEASRVTMSEESKIEIEVKNLDGDKMELTLTDNGQPLGKITQRLQKGKCLVTGGNAKNSTAWFVVINESK